MSQSPHSGHSFLLTIFRGITKKLPRLNPLIRVIHFYKDWNEDLQLQEMSQSPHSGHSFLYIVLFDRLASTMAKSQSPHSGHSFLLYSEKKFANFKYKGLNPLIRVIHFYLCGFIKNRRNRKPSQSPHSGHSFL